MPWTARTAIIASFVLLGCEQPAPPPAEATLIRALAVQVSQFDRTSALTGEIQARHESNLGFRVGGKVIERLRPSCWDHPSSDGPDCRRSRSSIFRHRHFSRRRRASRRSGSSISHGIR